MLVTSGRLHAIVPEEPPMPCECYLVLYEGRYLRKVLGGGCIVIGKRLLNPTKFQIQKIYEIDVLEDFM